MLAWRLLIALILLTCSSFTLAKSVKLEPLDAEGKRTWIIELADPPLVRFDGRNAVQERANRLEATAPEKTGKRLNLLSPQAGSYSRYLDEGLETFLFNTEKTIGGRAEIRARYKNLLNGVALRLTESQADQVRELVGVKSLIPNEILKIETDSSPELLGATGIWSGEAGNIPSRGEGIVIGIVDTGINWDHPSFADRASDGYNHSNPFGAQRGLCSDEEVLCNDKLIGVYDMTDEGSKGKGTNFHGSHVASIAAGNPLNVTVEGEATTMSGIAPRANIISYKVCREDDPATPGTDEDGCGSAEIIAGLEQALTDGVDVVNLSIGGGSSNPWDTYSLLFLEMRNAGIFAATSAGNDGPAPSSVSNPGLGPWLLAVAASTGSRVTGAQLQNLKGGDSPAPDSLAGAGLVPVNHAAGGWGPEDMLWAGDYGNALCGTGEPELFATCNEHTGSSNPFDPGTFSGEIVVCKRGEYGRVEKGFNVMQAGAGGYILINSEEFGESLRSDSHCIPGIHIGYSKGQELESWLTSGSDHSGTIGPFGLTYDDSVADVLGDFSAQGPNPAVPGALAPNITAPGVAVLGAGMEDDELAIVSGTSMSSPHVAGSGALMLSAEPGLTPSQIQSMLQTTATTEVRNYLGQPANPFEMGSGRVQLEEAINAGLYMNVTGSEFLGANPSRGGDASTLNLPGLVNPACRESCSFNRRLTDRAGGGDWTVTAEKFPADANVTVTPASFTIAAGAIQDIQVDFNLPPGTIGEWIFGEIKLSSNGLPDQHLTVAVYSSGGEVPWRWTIQSDRNGGWKEFTLGQLSQMPGATFSAGGLVRPSSRTETLYEDLTNDDPFDGDSGVMTEWLDVPEGSLWLYARTPASTAEDIDLYVGMDTNGNGLADEGEVLCESVSALDLESCDIFAPVAGSYWVLAQNWTASLTNRGDEVTLITALSSPSIDSSLAASGPGITAKNEQFAVRLSWDNVNALPGEEWLGAVGIGTDSDRPNNIGVIPVYFNRTGIEDARTFPLMAGTTHRLALEAEGKNNRVFIDVPGGASSLTVAAQGASDDQNNGLTLELVRLAFDDSLNDPPFASDPGNAPVIESATGNGPDGPSVTITGGDLTPGRWYAVLSNSNSEASAIEIRADVEFSSAPLELHPGLWQPGSRPGLGQGYEYNFGGGSRSLIWYTYDEDGQPAWYIGGNLDVTGNIWTADLLRVTNDGADQQLAPVGQVSVSTLAENDAMFSFTLYGESGTERMVPISALTCPNIGGSERSYTGLWYRGVDGLGGASILMNSSTQAQIHYLFDASGMPRWLFAQDEAEPAPTNPEIPMVQFSGYCAVCDPQTVSSKTVGVLGRSFSSETSGSWTLDYLFEPPLSGSAERTDQVIKLTDTIVCE
jgi:subtilisin family serine protease